MFISLVFGKHSVIQSLILSKWWIQILSSVQKRFGEVFFAFKEHGKAITENQRENVRLYSFQSSYRIPYDYAHILCKRTAWTIRKELIPIFGQGFTTEALHPDHPDYGCLLLDPKNLPANGKNSTQHKRNTMRQNNKPYCKRINTPKIRNAPKQMKNSSYLKKKQRQQKIEEEEKVRKLMISASMSVNRLLNDEDEDDILSSEEEFDDDEDDMMTDDNGSSTGSSTSSLSSPTFRVVQTYPPEQWSNSVPLLPPIYNNTNQPTTTTSPTHIAQDIIDTISATILLQRLSQDDGARPFKPFESSSVIPSKVIVGHQEFTICWD